MSRVASAAKFLRRAYKIQGALGLDDARAKYSGRPIQRELTLEEQLQRTQAELEVLKIENELLKKLRLMSKLLE